MNTVHEGYMQDAKGRLVPEHLVKEIDKLQDQLVKKCLGYADELSAQIARFKGHTFDDVAAFMDLLGEKYGQSKGGRKGNVTFTSFDGCAKVQVAVQDHIDFGPELQVAKGRIDECIEEWAADSRDEIRALVNHAFEVDKPGQVNREALFALRKIDIDDERWRSAMAAITDSIRVTGSKTYVRFYRRATPEDRWQAVTIDLAAVS
ncbi:MAG: DUF3164 family protein [Rhodospirillales bacterium]|nr:DUF3164 family protein [Rhodospirillales bacterium]